jgi:hypothetical protein
MRNPRRRVGFVAVLVLIVAPFAVASAAFADDPSTQSTATVANGTQLRDEWADTDNTVITLTDDIDIGECNEGGPLRDTGGTGIVIDGQGLYGINQTCEFTRVLLDNGVEQVTLRGLTHFQGGFACGAGGGLYTNGAVVVESSVVNDNVASQGAACSGAVESEPVGGGVYSDSGPTTVTNATFRGNHADEAGGGFAASGSTTVTSSTFEENSAGTAGDTLDDFAGGGFATLSGALVTGSTFTGNFMGEFSGEHGLCSSCAVYGGGFWADDGSTIQSSTFNGNHADCLGNCFAGGGAISSNEDLTVGGSSFNENQVYCGGSCGADGGALYAPSTDVSGSSFGGNSAGCDEECDNYGGAIYTAGFSVSGSSFTSNTADCTDFCAAEGGAIATQGVDEVASSNGRTKSYAPDASSFAQGGWGGTAGAFEAVDPGVDTVTQSTFSGNRAECELGGCGGSGGGLYLESLISLTVDASTFDHNVVTYDGAAVAVYSHGEPRMTFTNSTIVQNTGGTSGALSLQSGTAAFAYDTIVQNALTEPPTPVPFAGDAANVSALAPTFFGTIVALPIGGVNCDLDAQHSQGYNFSDDETCGFDQATDKVSTPNDPGLGALGANGGPTQTMVPQTGSPVIDAIPAAACQTGIAAGIAVDQRGVTRPQGPGCDIGAVEVEVVAPPAPSPAVVVTPKFTG